MNMKVLLKLFVFFLIGILLIGCDKENPDDKTKDNPDDKIKEKI